MHRELKISQKLSGLLLKASFVLIGIVIALLTVELILRVFFSLSYQNKYYLWPPYLSKIVTPIPGVLPGISGQKRFFINSAGIRGSEPSAEYNYRILALGGSTTESGELDEDETWPALLQKKINQEKNIKSWVGNAGRRASTSRENLIQMKYFAPQIKNVDSILLLVGVNDFMMSLEENYQPVFNNLNKTPTADEFDRAFFIHPYTHLGLKGTATWSLIKKIKVTFLGRKKIVEADGKTQLFWRNQRQNSDIIENLPDLKLALREYRSNLEQIVSLSKTRKIRLILITQPSLWQENMPKELAALLWFGCIDKEKSHWRCYSPEVLNHGLTKYNETLLNVCHDYQIECIDLADKLPKDTSIFTDDVHFNENGAREVAKEVYEYLTTQQFIIKN